MKKLLIALSLVLLSIQVQAQTIVQVSVNDDLGQAQEGVRVYAFNNSSYANKSAITNSEGVANITLDDGDYRFRVDKSGTQYFSASSNHCNTPSCSAVEVEIPRPTQVIVNSTGGGVEQGLRVYAFDSNSYRNKSATTDASGIAHFQLPEGDYRFRIDKNGTQFFTSPSNHCSVPSCTSLSYDVPESVVVNVSGESGLRVYAFDDNSYTNKSATTDVNGDAVFTLLPGNYRFRIDKNGTQYFTDDANHCAVPSCSAVSFDMPGPVSLSVSSSTGAPEQGLKVYAFDGNSYVNKSATTDVNGIATFSLLTGDYRFRIDKNGTQFFTSSENHCAVPGCDALSFEIPEPVNISVTSSTGAPEAGLKVYAFNGNSYVNKSATTDANGLASFTLLPGSYRFRIDKNGTQFYTDTVNHCDLPGCNSVAYEIPESVTVNVSSSAGGAEPGLKVYAFNGTSYVNKSATTDANGQANFTLLPGSYRFRIDKNGTQFYTDTINHCDLPSCNSVAYEIPESVTVNVSSSAGGAEAGLKVYAFSGASYVNKSATTDANGQANFTLLPGSYRFRIDKNGTQFFTDTLNHCDAPGCNGVSYEVPESVTVEVNNTVGTPEAGLKVYAFNGSSYANKSATTDSNGLASFTLLPGSYRFRVDKAGTQYFTSMDNHCDVPSCSYVLQNLPAPLSAFVVDPALGACVDSAAAANGWAIPADVTSLNCDGLGITTLDGVQSFAGLTSLSISDNPITQLAALHDLSQLTSLDLSNNSSLECGRLGELDSILGAGVVTHPASCLGEGDLVFSIDNPGKPASNQFSFAVASTPNGDIISSAITYNPFTDSYDGRVYLIDGNTGLALIEVVNPDESGSDYFGWSVTATSSGDVVVGAWNDDVAGVAAGVVYVFDGIDGTLLTTIENPNPTLGDRFGYALATTSDDNIVVGAYQEEGGGAVYIFDEDGMLIRTLFNASGDVNEEFGKALSALESGDIVVGAPKQDVDLIVDAGAVQVFSGLDGSLLLNIENPSPEALDEYGSAVHATSINTIAVSARFKDNAAANDGSVFVHDGVNGALVWSVANPLADVNGGFAASLGSTAMGHLVVGAANDDAFATNSGRVYVYSGNDGTLIKRIDNPEPLSDVNFGQGLTVTPSNQIAVGAFGADGGFGKLYLFASVATGELLLPVNELTFTDPALQSCVLNQAAVNGWATVDEFTALNCSNAGIVNVTGLDALTALESLDLTENDQILCSDLDALETTLSNTVITRPNCDNGGSGNAVQQVQNLHNAQGQRVVKTVSGDINTAVHFIYNQAGQVIAEIDATTGTTLREYVYVNGQQIAVVDDTGTQAEATYFVHNDHLGTPQKITDQTQELVWSATYKPFGEVEVDVATIENNIRFPGQYADGESGLHYNYFRDYDPSLGRYVQSDKLDLLYRTYDPALVLTSSLGAFSFFSPNANYKERAESNYYDASTLASNLVLNQPYSYALNNVNNYTDEYGLNPSRVLFTVAVAVAKAAKRKIEAGIKYCKSIKCKLENHDAHHKFGWPYNEKRKHIQLTCWRVGVKNSTFILRFPY